MLPALTAIGAAVITAAAGALLRASEARAHRRELAEARQERERETERSDVWRAIDSLRAVQADLQGNVATLTGYVTGLFREVLDDPEVWRPPAVRGRDRGGR